MTKVKNKHEIRLFRVINNKIRNKRKHKPPCGHYPKSHNHLCPELHLPASLKIHVLEHYYSNV